MIHTVGGVLCALLGADDGVAFMEGTAVRVFDGTVDLAR